MLGRAEAGDGASAGEPGAVRQPGADGTLLAVVPIPGTGTSLAIVGYPVTAQGSMVGAAGAAAASQVLDHASLDHTGTAGERPGLLLDHDQRRVWVDGAEVALTFQEFELLAFLAAHPATVFSRADLVREVWQRDFAADSRTVDVHVSRLRHKLGPSYGRCLVTEYRVGYQFRPLAADVRACLADGDTEEDALLAFHRRTVVIPVRVLA
jgi:DNA-binding winged helix-turn-helix (wHTH) protein